MNIFNKLNRNKPYGLALHIFRRDLRLHDNTALIAALAQAEQVIPAFIFDKRQIELSNYKSQACLQFMATSLQELAAALKKKQSQLYCFYGIAEDVVEQLLTSLEIQAVYVNEDYTPFSRARDKHILDVCQKKKVAFHSHADALLHEPEQVVKADQKPYTIYTPAYRRAMQIPVQEVQKNSASNYYSLPISGSDTKTLQKLSQKNLPNLRVKGGREEGLKLLRESLDLTNYTSMRDYPAAAYTTTLSAHHKFGTVSIREVYHAIANEFGSEHTLIKELYWRDFFTHIAYFFPRVFGQAFQKKYAQLSWSKNEKHFRAWCEGQTGFPIVDAGMRELNSTGFMHNRVRMITASFLTKDLHIDWRWGEKYFAQKLVDYDPAVNNGNWQWAASTGCDAQPYFRIFNPWLQQEKFDPECVYIKKWIPELAAVDVNKIHQLYKDSGKLIVNYPEPIVDHKVESERTKKLFASHA